MDLSTPQSSSKCTSDFSIERILSDDCKSDEHGQTPSWLCCTRYQPPRLPRNNSACRSRRSGRHARVPFTASQASALEAAYSRAPYLAPPALRALAAALQLRDDRIKIWFQNRRARERREKCSTVRPPHAITLPSTNPAIQNTWMDTNTRLFTERNTRRHEGSAFVQSLIHQSSHESTDGRTLSDDSSECRSESPLDVETID